MFFNIAIYCTVNLFLTRKPSQWAEENFSTLAGLFYNMTGRLLSGIGYGLEKYCRVYDFTTFSPATHVFNIFLMSQHHLNRITSIEKQWLKQHLSGFLS